MACIVFLQTLEIVDGFINFGLSRKTLNVKFVLQTKNDDDINDSCYSKKRIRHFINLTNGLEAIPSLFENEEIPLSAISYIRIQSTHCESRNYNAILESLDNNLLMNLALGNYCVIYDFGSRGTGRMIGDEDPRSGIPRAFWMGIEWIRHVLASSWNLEEAMMDKRYVRGYNSKDLFDEKMKEIPKVLRRKLTYFRPFVQTKRLHIYPVYRKTIYDNERDFYYGIAQQLFHYADEENDPASSENTSIAKYLKQVIPKDMYMYDGEEFLGVGRDSKNS
jgi:hypothetical protein